MTTRCEHQNFEASTRVARLTVAEGGPVMSFSMDVMVKCKDCDLPFRFMGLPFGSHPTEPRLSADSTELRAPIEPAYAPEILGVSLTRGEA